MNEVFGNSFIINDNVEKEDKFDEKFLKEGKSIYEVLKVLDGVPLFLERHISRLNNSGILSKNEIWLSFEEIKASVLKLIEINKFEIGNVKLIFNFNGDEKNFLAYFIKHSYPSKGDYENGVETILYCGERENPNAKIINYNFKQAVEEKIKISGVYEAILVNNNGYITEGSRSNMFIVKDDVLYTAPILDVLPGITRGVVLEICKKLNIKIIEKCYIANEISSIDGIFLTGTSPNALPIKMIDNFIINSTKNEIIKKIMKEFDGIVKSYVENN